MIFLNVKQWGLFKLPYSQNNDRRTERAKIAFQFVLMSVCSLIMGHLIARSFSDAFYVDRSLNVSTHFEAIFLHCSNFGDYFTCILSYALSDLLCVLLIFCVSFATFNYIISDLVLVYSGMRTGLVISFLMFFLSDTNTSYNVAPIKFIVFVVFELLCLIIVWDYSYRAAIHSYELKKVTVSGRSAANTSVVVAFLINTAMYLGTILLISGSYCWLIYILK